MKAIYSEPLLPQNEARQIIRSGDANVDGINRALERVRSKIFGKRGSKITPGIEPVALKKDNPQQTQSFSQPRMSDLWYLWDVQEDPLGEDDEVKDALEENLHGVKLVRTVISPSGLKKRRAFTMDYEWVPEGETPSVELEADGAISCVEFLTGDLMAAENTIFLGEETGEVNRVKEGGKLLPPTPPRAGGDEVILTHAFYLHEDDVKIIESSPLNPFTVTRKELLEEDKFPTPGEFVGMAVRAWPNHAWFSQESNPFIFSANWFETNHYSSGIVEAVNPVEDSDTDFTYDIRVRGKLEVNVPSTDFKKYEEEERVALLKVDGIENDGVFTNENMKENGYNETWRVIPITFFQE